MEKYLSATVVQEKLKELCDRYSVQYGGDSEGFGKAIAEFTENLPATDNVEKKRHSKWIKHSGYDAHSGYGYGVEYSCECCNEWVKEKLSFCPECGAEMDEEG